MSRALAFVAGIAVIIAGLLFLFAPETDTQTDSGTTPANEAEANDNEPADRAGATADNARAASASGSSPAKDVSRWPDPDATSALPARPDNPARDARPVISLWKADSSPTRTDVDGFPATRLKADPQTLTTLHVGQQVALQVPELNHTFTARLDTTHNQLNDVQVFRGAVSGGHDKDNVVVTRGQRSTYVVLSTREGTYSAVIDNQSGDTVLTSETDVQDNLAGQDDAIPVPGIDQEPPGDPSG